VTVAFNFIRERTVYLLYSEAIALLSGFVNNRIYSSVRVLFGFFISSVENRFVYAARDA
jgi:hypothetical protein